jgi:hypothetical protein
VRGTNARGQGRPGRPLEEALEGIPPDRLRWARGLDDLGLIDTDSQEIYVSETKLRKLLRGGLFPPEFEDRCVRKLSELPGSKLVKQRDDDNEGDKMRSIRWQELANRAGLFDEAPPDPEYKVPLNKTSNMAEVRRVVKQRFRDVPDGMFDHETLSPRIREVVEAPADAPTEAEASFWPVWDCVVRHLGWWAAFGLFSILGAALVAISIVTAGTATVAAGWVVFWILSAFGLGAGTVAVVGNCILNPYW